MIVDVRNVVMAEANKDNNGYISPDDFNLFCHKAQIDIFESYFHAVNLKTLKLNNQIISGGVNNLTKRQKEVIAIFTEDAVLEWSAVTQSYVSPENSFWMKDIYYNGRDVDIISDSKAKRALLIPDLVPTTEFPIGVIKSNQDIVNFPDRNRSIKIYPTTITGTGLVTAEHIRYPKQPKWTYSSIVNGEPVFNQTSEYQDFEVPQDEFNNLVNKILQYAGIEIREPELVQYGAGQNMIEEQKKSTK